MSSTDSANESSARVLRVFHHEVAKQCGYGVLAAQMVNGGLNAIESPDMQAVDMKRINRQIWFGIQGILIAAANISKLLWGSRRNDPETQKRQDAERARLRDSLGVDDTSPLRSRKFRNFFEHFDREIEIWASISRRRNLVDDFIGSRDAIPGLNWRDFLRTFDPKTTIVTLRRMELELQPIVSAMEELEATAVAAYQASFNPDQPSSSEGNG